MRKKTVDKLKFATVFVVVCGVGAAFYLGIITPEQARHLGRKAFYEGKDLANEAVTTVIDGEPNFGPKGDGDYESAERCRRNLRRIETAKRSTPTARHVSVGSVPLAEVRDQLGGSLPKCPLGGKYEIGYLVQNPTCSIGAAGLRDNKDDHVVHNL